MCMRMNNPEKRKYLYWMLAGFGAISLSVIFFFLLYRLQSVEEILEKIVDILMPSAQTHVQLVFRRLPSAFEGQAQ